MQVFVNIRLAKYDELHQTGDRLPAVSGQGIMLFEWNVIKWRFPSWFNPMYALIA